MGNPNRSARQAWREMNLVARWLFSFLALLSAVLVSWFSHSVSFVQGDLEPWTYGVDLQAIVEKSLESEDGYTRAGFRVNAKTLGVSQ